MKIEVTPPEQSPIQPYAFDRILSIDMISGPPGLAMAQVRGENDSDMQLSYKKKFYKAFYGNYLIPNGSFVNYESKYDSGKTVLTKASDFIIFVNRVKLILGLEET